MPPHQRNVNTVFQSYALFPHLDVAKNVAFGLKYHKLSKDERAKRVGEALELVDMTEFARRKADQLSGGQQQRVALARALVLRPRVLLLDEPLGALDAQLRKNLQVELKTLQAELGITFIFVTHDQAEALTMSDRIAVMNGGHVEQAASPKEIYEEPDTVFVADFLGVSNLLAATAIGQDGSACAVKVGDRTLRAQQGTMDARGDVKVMIRPERIAIEPHTSQGEQRLPGWSSGRSTWAAPTAAHPRARRRDAQGHGAERRGRLRPPPWSRATRSASISARGTAGAHPDRARGTGRGRREHGRRGRGAAARVAADCRRAYWQNTFAHWSGFPFPFRGVAPQVCHPGHCLDPEIAVVVRAVAPEPGSRVLHLDAIALVVVGVVARTSVPVTSGPTKIPSPTEPPGRARVDQMESGRLVLGHDVVRAGEQQIPPGSTASPVTVLPTMRFSEPLTSMPVPKPKPLISL